MILQKKSADNVKSVCPNEQTLLNRKSRHMEIICRVS